MGVELVSVSVYIGTDVHVRKSFVTQAGDSHFEQNSDKSAVKSWQLRILAVMGHSMANQLWLLTVSILYMHACECDY